MRLVITVLSLLVAAELVLSCGGSGSGSAGNGGGGGQCSGGPSDPTCDFTECGGDATGSWKLIDFCAPSCVSSVDDVVTYASNADVGAPYCVQGDVLWTRRSTNCGPGQSTTLIIVRRRDCGVVSGGGGSGAR